MFQPLSKQSVDEREREVLHFWDTERIFEQSLQQRAKSKFFSFYDGPPFATGLPHYGHLLAGTIKDVVPRYKTMKGFYVPRRFGWDCHGLPVENEIEKAQGLSGAKQIEAFGIAQFNEECRRIVLRYTQEWKSTVNRMGRWVDFSRTYHTMDSSFMESVWWVFKQLYEAGLVYEGYKVMPFSAKLGTPLSNFEAGENYKEVDDPSLTVSLPLADDPSTALLIWTTTPWTLVSNLAVMVGPDLEYVKVRLKGQQQQYLLARARLEANFPNPSDYDIVDTFPGKALEGRRYLPLFDYFASRAAQGAFRVLLAPEVSHEEGTGIVHCAPAFGEVDFYACQRGGIELVCPVDTNGHFTAEVPEYQGLFVKEADKPIIRRLKEMGRLFHQATLRHRYPFCYRSDTPLIYKAVSTWFVAVEKIKDQLLENNRQIHWTPAHVKEGRFGKWLEGARDWAISRNRYWGTPIPLWRAEDGELLVVGSVAELEKLTGARVTDLHRHYIDSLEIEHKGKTYKRITEVFDCWFESGSMPYAQNHYPFDNQQLFEQSFPADFIGEGLDQTRGWFYTLHILATALFNRPAFRHVIVNGIVLAEDGAKMSKRLRNYPDPMEVVGRFGADAIRLYMLHSPAVKADDLRFSERGVELVLRQILIPWWNAYSFFLTYARIYHWKPTAKVVKPEAEIDRWILSLLHQLIQTVEEGMNAYDLSRAVEPFVGFIDQLTNWYIRRSRRRFWEDEATPDRDQAFATLYTVLVELAKIAAPFVPFMSESMYRNLRQEAMPVSVHLCDYPAYKAEWRDQELEEAMQAVQTTVSLGHALRKEHKFKVRQPLARAWLAIGDQSQFTYLKNHQQLIADELNVKEIHFGQDEQQFVQLKAKPNFRELGKKLGSRMKQAQEAITQLSHDQLVRLLDGETITLPFAEGPIALTPQEVQVERVVKEGLVAANAGQITIVLDTQLDEQLLREGLAREMVNKINTMRRDMDLDVSDRITLRLQTTPKVRECFEQYAAYIQGEVLATEVLFEPTEGTEWDLNGEPTTIAIQITDRN